MDAGSARGQPREDLRSGVWMMHSGVGTDGLPGTLTLEAGAVVFRPKDASRGTERFPVARIRRARSTMAGPILELRMQRGTVPRIVGFYFVPPPSWEPPERESGMRTTTARKARKAAATKLLTAGVDKREDVKRWVQAVRRAKKKE